MGPEFEQLNVAVVSNRDSNSVSQSQYHFLFEVSLSFVTEGGLFSRELSLLINTTKLP